MTTAVASASAKGEISPVTNAQESRKAALTIALIDGLELQRLIHPETEVAFLSTGVRIHTSLAGLRLVPLIGRKKGQLPKTAHGG